MLFWLMDNVTVSSILYKRQDREADLDMDEIQGPYDSSASAYKLVEKLLNFSFWLVVV